MREFKSVSSDEMEDHLGDDKPVGHICLYLLDHEIHADFHGEADNLLDLAEGIGQFVTHAIIETFTESTSCQH